MKLSEPMNSLIHGDWRTILTESYLEPWEAPKLTVKDGFAFFVFFVALVSLIAAVVFLVTATYVVAGVCGAIASVCAVVFNHFTNTADFQQGKLE